MRKLNKSELKRVYGGIHDKGQGRSTDGAGTSGNTDLGGSNEASTLVS